MRRLLALAVGDRVHNALKPWEHWTVILNDRYAVAAMHGGFAVRAVRLMSHKNWGFLGKTEHMTEEEFQNLRYGDHVCYPTQHARQEAWTVVLNDREIVVAVSGVEAKDVVRLKEPLLWIKEEVKVPR